jgi:GNAT superfamily N-acetyltransferase
VIEIIALEDRHRPEWLPLWRGYQQSYEVEIDGETTDLTWRRLLDPSEPMFVLGALKEGHLVGIVHFLFHRSTWTKGDYCYLQDLFTASEARGSGVGRALIAAVCGRASSSIASGYRRFRRRPIPVSKRRVRMTRTSHRFSVVPIMD